MKVLFKEKVEVQNKFGLRNGEILIVENCAAIVGQGVDLIEKLDNALYVYAEIGSKSTVGAHFRHNLDFLTNFFEGLKTGRIDYHRRERELKVETDRSYALQRFQMVLGDFEKLSGDDLRRKILVSSETLREMFFDSSVLRELEFLQSHTIHHYALIQTKLTTAGFQVPANFGVAPSTLEFWKSQTA